MRAPILPRRAALQLAGGLALSVAGGGAAISADSGDAKLVFVILRGALDGLAAAPPYADPAYAALRKSLALAPPGAASGGALPLAEGFGLHPKLVFLHELWRGGELSLLHAAATPYRERSHFDGQDLLESGGAAAYALSDGWLGRALAAGPVRSGVAVAPALPLVLRGPAPTSNYAPSFAPTPGADVVARLMDLYADDRLLGPALAKAAATEATAGAGGMQDAAKGRGAYGGARWSALSGAAARLLSAPGGPAAGVLAFDGWDTHANQGAAEGQLAIRLAALDAALRTLKDGLGAAWSRTAVLVATEFGRTAAVNGTGGTDHGTGGAAFLLGGAVRGGRVLGDWPGLAALRDNRDVAPANDLRALFAGVLAEHWGLGRSELQSRVFPGLAGARRIEGVLKA